jgi:hypothetical protein
MVRDREAERVRELERQREREQKWASGHDEGSVGGGSFMRRGGLRRGQGRLFFFNFATNDLGTTGGWRIYRADPDLACLLLIPNVLAV